MNEQQEMTEDEALMKLAQAMKDNVGGSDDKHNIHTFLDKIARAKDTTKVGNLRVDKNLDELGLPVNTFRGLKEMEIIADKIMDNKFFSDFFRREAEDIMASSLSREGFLVRQGTTQTKQVADITKKRKISKGFLGKERIEEQGGDTTTGR
jgi:hypothetical protein